MGGSNRRVPCAFSHGPSEGCVTQSDHSMRSWPIELSVCVCKPRWFKAWGQMGAAPRCRCGVFRTTPASQEPARKWQPRRVAADLGRRHGRSSATAGAQANTFVDVSGPRCGPSLRHSYLAPPSSPNLSVMPSRSEVRVVCYLAAGTLDSLAQRGSISSSIAILASSIAVLLRTGTGPRPRRLCSHGPTSPGGRQ